MRYGFAKETDMEDFGEVKVWGSPIDEGALSQIATCAATGAAYCALMADHHKGYAVPIGGVVAYRDAISPSGVGFDIGCGNKAVRLDMPAREARNKIGKIMDDIAGSLSFGMGRVNAEKVDHALFDQPDEEVGQRERIPLACALEERGRLSSRVVGHGGRV